MRTESTRVKKDENKDLNNIIFVIFEGEVTEKVYMELLHENRYTLNLKKNITFHIINTKQNHPNKILEELCNEYYSFEDKDQVYFFTDIDKHFKSCESYVQCIESYEQSHITPIVCNRCFELLLLLHVVKKEDLISLIPQMYNSCENNTLIKLLRETTQDYNYKWVNIKKSFKDDIERKERFSCIFISNIDNLIGNLKYVKKENLLETDIIKLYSSYGTNALDFYTTIRTN